MNTAHRIVFGSGRPGGQHLIPEILEIGWGNFTTADTGHLRPHTHPGAFEFCLICSGEVEWVTADSCYVLREGDVYITQPNEVHWGRDTAMHPCELYWIIVGSIGCGGQWSGIDSNLVEHLDRRLRAIKTHRLRGSTKLRNAFEEILQEHAVDSHPSCEILRQGNARTALHRLIIELVRAADRECVRDDGAAQRRIPRSVSRAMELLHQNAHDGNYVRHLGEISAAARKRLNQNFIQYVGSGITQYWLRERVRLARNKLLEEEASVTSVATELGFSSSQHFATVFRKITGLTPGEYRRAARLQPLNCETSISDIRPRCLRACSGCARID